jgi:RimJ/RimL family protein N-acetyltransferase
MLVMPVLETQRLVVRPFAMGDLEPVQRLYDHDWGRGDSDMRPRSMEERREWLAWTVRTYHELAQLNQPPLGERAIVRRHDLAIVGAIGMVPCLAAFAKLPWHSGFQTRAQGFATAEYGLFWALGRQFRGHGYATEAAEAVIGHGFKTLRMRRWIATTEHANVASQAVMRRLGFRVESNPYADPPWLQVVGVLENPDLHATEGDRPKTDAG